MSRHKSWQPLYRCNKLVQHDPTTAEAATFRAAFAAGAVEMWRNDLYVITVWRGEPHPIYFEGVTHLSIRRVDRRPCRDWRHFQWIKNELCGPEAEGLELYPAESRLTDEANQYHIYVIVGLSLPFGVFAARSVGTAAEAAAVGAVQRP